MVLSEQFKAKDLQTYRNQLLEYDKFNELNENLYDMYRKSSLFNKIQYRTGTRIITYQNEPILLIWSETRSYNVRIRSIIPLTDKEKLETDSAGGRDGRFSETVCLSTWISISLSTP